MLYFDIFLLTILIILFFILCFKILQNEDQELREGFLQERRSITAKNKKHKDDTSIDEDEVKKQNDTPTIVLTKQTYSIADQLAYILIKVPYQIIEKMLTLVKKFFINLKDITKPITEFVKKLWNIFYGIFKKIFNFIKKIGKKFTGILTDLPGFLKKNLGNLIDFITSFVLSLTKVFQKLTASIWKILKLIGKLPEMIFGLLSKLIDLIINLLIIIIKLPEAIVGMIVSLQDQMITLMDKSFRIPFMNLFFG